MNKIIITILLCILPSILFAKRESTKYSFNEVAITEGVLKNELYNRALIYLTKKLYFANDAIQMKDKEDGHIIAKCALEYKAPAFNPGTNCTGYFIFIVDFECKDGRYRYTINNIEHRSTVNGHFEIGYFDNPKKRNQKIISTGIKYVEDFIKDFKVGMDLKVKDDW